MSVKHISKRVAEELYRMRENQYTYFTDLLVDMNLKPAFNTRSVEILIRMGYFEEFGPSGKLLAIMKAFNEGTICYKKTYCDATKKKRLTALYELESSMEEIQIPVSEQIAFEIEHFGTPVSVFPNARMTMAVLEVDDKYSPKIRLYNVAKGTVGMMKMKKDVYKRNPLAIGDVLVLKDYDKKPARRYVGGKSVVNPGVFDLWILKFEKIFSTLCETA